MSATQFGVCKCGFDRKAHEKRKEDSKGMPHEKKDTSAPPAVPKIVGVAPMPAATKSSSQMPVVKGKGKGKGKEKPATGTTESSLPSVDTKPATVTRQEPFDAIAKLQAVIQGAGFSPLSAHAGTEAAKHVCDLPDSLLSALLTIMNATQRNTDCGKRVSFESAHSANSSLDDAISRDAIKVVTAPVAAVSTDATKPPSLFNTAAPAMFKASAAPHLEATCAPCTTETDAAACSNFQVDLTSSQFGMCRCGFDRASHSSLGKVNQTVTMRGRETQVTTASSAASRHSSAPKEAPLIKTTPKFGIKAIVRSASARFERTPEPIASSSTSNEPGPCDVFQLDMSSTQFAMCKCGFDRNAHVQSRRCGHSDPNDAKASTRRYTLEHLRNCKSSGNLDGLDAGRLDDFLEEREFLKAFGMFIGDFYKLPAWKQKQAKQKAGIF
jgi:hypothetical protein